MMLYGVFFYKVYFEVILSNKISDNNTKYDSPEFG